MTPFVPKFVIQPTGGNRIHVVGTSTSCSLVQLYNTAQQVIITVITGKTATVLGQKWKQK